LTVDRKKELKQLYKQMKPEMGIFIIRALDDGRCYLQATPNLKGTINATKFKLDAGRHPHRELQKAWQERGVANFVFEVLEKLEYDKDETKTDYSEELEILQMVWADKLAQAETVFF
jgi:hypothetical protein